MLLAYDLLKKSVAGSAAALRSITQLQPVEGPGGKIFPATYDKGSYAREKRRIRDKNGANPEVECEREVDCVLLNSVQSEANHAELALLRAIESGSISLPLIEVDFSSVNEKFRQPVPKLTSLEVPHRLADAILRDSQLEDGTRFSKSSFAQSWSKANLWNATPVFAICPTALVYGMWGSPDKPGGLGAKFERAYVSEIIAVDLVTSDPKDLRRGYRIDPLSASSKVLLVQEAERFSVVGEAKNNNTAIPPSKLNHGNIPFSTTNSGIRCRYAEQTSVISLGALRKLRFPFDKQLNSASNAEADTVARTVLAAIALCGATLAAEAGTSLRSRCHLFPTAPRRWEILEVPGQPATHIEVDSKAAIEVLKQAVAAAQKLKLPWETGKISLTPTPELVELIRQSQEVMAKEKGEGGETQ